MARKKLSAAKARNAVGALSVLLDNTGHDPRLSAAERDQLTQALDLCDQLADRLHADDYAAAHPQQEGCDG